MQPPGTMPGLLGAVGPTALQGCEPGEHEGGAFGARVGRWDHVLRVVQDDRLG